MWSYKRVISFRINELRIHNLAKNHGTYMMFKKQVLCALTALCTTSLLLRFLSNHVDSAKVLNQIISALNLPLLQAQMHLRPIPAGSLCKTSSLKWSTQFTRKNRRTRKWDREIKERINQPLCRSGSTSWTVAAKIEPAEDTSAEDNQQDISPSVSSNAPVATNQASTTQQPSEQEKRLIPLHWMPIKWWCS